MSIATLESGLLERGLLSRTRLWQQTLSQAGRTVGVSALPWVRPRTRLAAFRPLQDPVFILGCPRSGTTYLGTLLEALPSVSYYFEPPLLKYYVRLIDEGGIGSPHARFVYEAGLRSLLLVAPGNGSRIVEKNPGHVFIAEKLAMMFPQAKFIVITRDGRDVALSLSEKPWHRADSMNTGMREPSGYLYGTYPHFYIEHDRREEYADTSDVHRAIWIWRRHQEEVEAIRDAGGEEYCHIRYEDLVLRPDETVDKLLAFLGVPPDERQPVLLKAATGHASSVGRWRKGFGERDIAVIEAEAGELLRRLGYD